MKKLTSYFLTAFLAVPFAMTTAHASAGNRTPTVQEQDERRALRTPQTNRRTHTVRGDRRRSRGIGNALGKAGRSYGRAGASLGRGTGRLARNVAVGRPVRGGKEFGKGVGGFGKNVGIGTGYVGVAAGRTGKRIGQGTAATARAGARGTRAAARGTGRAVRRAVTP